MSLHDAIDLGLTALAPSRARVQVGSGGMGSLGLLTPLILAPLALPVGGAMMIFGRNDREGRAWRYGKVALGVGAATTAFDLWLLS
jgi:hypothetical protein